MQLVAIHLVDVQYVFSSRLTQDCREALNSALSPHLLAASSLAEHAERVYAVALTHVEKISDGNKNDEAIQR